MEDLNDRLTAIAQDETACAAFVGQVLKEIITDDEDPTEKGRRLIEAYLNGNIEDFFIELTGWRMETLVSRFQRGLC